MSNIFQTHYEDLLRTRMEHAQQELAGHGPVETEKTASAQSAATNMNDDEVVEKVASYLESALGLNKTAEDKNDYFAERMGTSRRGAAVEGGILGAGIGGFAGAILPSSRVGRIAGGIGGALLGGAAIGALNYATQDAVRGQQARALLGRVNKGNIKDLTKEERRVLDDLTSRGPSSFQKKEGSASDIQAEAKRQILAKIAGMEVSAPNIQDKSRADFEGVTETGDGPKATWPGADLVGSNEAAMDYTKRDAKNLIRGELGKLFDAPILSSKADPTLQKSFANADRAGAKLASNAKVNSLLARFGRA